MTWYRQYFWLLVFGSIILFTAIISFAMVCFCKTHLSKSVTNRMQKTFKLKKRIKSAVVKNNSIYNRSSPQVRLPNRMEKDTVISENIISVFPPDMYPSPQDLYWKYKVDTSHSHIPNHTDRYSYASDDSLESSISEVRYPNAASEAICENSNSRLYTTVQKKPKLFGLQDTQYYANNKNNISHITNYNDRYSNASYDSVGSSIPNISYTNASAAGTAYYTKKEDRVLHMPNPNDRYSCASYDSVGIRISEASFSNKVAAEMCNPNYRYSCASYDSVGSRISEAGYTNAAAAERDYVEVIPEGGEEDYDDVDSLTISQMDTL